MPTITKRDGSSEDFQPEKIIAVLQAAGLEPDEAKQVADETANRVKASTLSTLTSLQIRDIVIQILEAKFPYVAGLFKWYQKTKDASINV